MTMAFPTNTVTMPIANLAVFGKTGLSAQRTFTCRPGITFLAVTNSTIAGAMAATEFPIMSRAIEVIAFAELAADNFLGILELILRVPGETLTYGSGEARTDSAFAYTTSRTDQAVVVPGRFC